MSMQRRYALIGTFVFGAIVIAAIGVAIFFGGQFARDKVQALMVFRGTVTGLDVGTPVQVRGIPIGEVRRIRTLYDPESQTVMFAVYAQFTGTIEVRDGMPASKLAGDPRAWLTDMIERGLRAQLQTKSWVTGQQMIMLDFKPEVAPRMSELEPGVIEIPTVRSPNEELLARLSEAPIQELLSEGRTAVLGIRRLVVDDEGRPGPLPQLVEQLSVVGRELGQGLPKLERELTETAASARTLMSEATTTARAARGAIEDARAAVGDARGTLRSIGETTERLGRQVERGTDSMVSATGDFGRLVGRIEQSLGRIDGSLQRFEHAMSQDAPIGSALVGSLTELGEAARALRTLIEELERQPNALITGRQGANR